MYDPIVDEVRKAGEEYARQFNYDLDAMCADLRRKEHESGALIVTLPRRPPVSRALGVKGGGTGASVQR